jgi:hypothetical protein
VLRDAWGIWVIPLALFALCGLFQSGGELWFGMGCLLSLMGVHLIFAHPLNWSLYYQEGQPALALVTALGIAWMAGTVTGRMTEASSPAGSARPTLACWLVVLCAAATGVSVIAAAREKKTKDSAYHEAFHELVAGLPGRTIVFVRYSPIHRFYTSLIDNPPDLDRSPSWIVHDLEGENVRLIELAPDRTPYLYIEQKKTMVPLNRDGSQASAR